ncbi:hypothetical protein IWX90DRAFT_5872 [Phyllosticta citrichinensis]|uniref:Uncharacterized protein n=1 Tax=Phyllosticta citrichinensis TaxID=1130410 RepID=A0ABR1Y577_9PEZI
MSHQAPLERSHSQHRPPAPSLFIGPPSRNASNTSMALPPGTGAPSSGRAPLLRQRSKLGEAVTDAEGNLAPSTRSIRAEQRTAQTQHYEAEQESAERTDAIWAEMQNTLEEVELSAIHGTHVFRPGHSKALEDLRSAQIALAQAWAKTEAEDEQQDAAAKREEARPLGTSNLLASDRNERLGTAAPVVTGRPRSGTEASVKSQLEQDTENDILLARKRREANDRYFQRVNAGVLDVVAKLDEVAKAMKGVEQESKEIWGDGESMETRSYASK